MIYRLLDENVRMKMGAESERWGRNAGTQAYFEHLEIQTRKFRPDLLKEGG